MENKEFFINAKQVNVPCYWLSIKYTFSYSYWIFPKLLMQMTTSLFYKIPVIFYRFFSIFFEYLFPL